ncbi:hypothetical protein VTJ49DRAFT_4826 [Mycothermus thermophilus]|uniref:Uncharacterized protein n=1 Tax=Humicola insolens TaxID=85995 RepID=A0ABR3V4E2_HUMIN
MTELTDLDSGLDDASKHDILSVFGVEVTPPKVSAMAPYFEYFAQELTASAMFDHLSNAETREALKILKLLKAHPNTRKEDIRDPSVPATGPALDFGVRAMLMTQCRTPGVFAGGVFNPEWKPCETLTEFVNRVYPRAEAPADDNYRRGPVVIERMAAPGLKTNVHITIEWTNHLTDHLELLVSADWKRLHVFRYPCYLNMCLKALEADRPNLDHSTEAALALGSLPPALLKETLKTYSLLFPQTDFASQDMLREAMGHDSATLESFGGMSSGHERRQDARRPETIADLYDKFPYWADRLEHLWREVENPRPVTRVERWVDKRKDQRWSTWWVVLGVMLAVLFGITATILGALQVWISYCSWLDDPRVAGCSAKLPVHGEAVGD